MIVAQWLYALAAVAVISGILGFTAFAQPVAPVAKVVFWISAIGFVMLLGATIFGVKRPPP